MTYFTLLMTDSGSIHISTNDPFHSFRWLSNILLYLCTTSSLFILRLKTDPEFWIHSKQPPAAHAPFHCFPQSTPLSVKKAETSVQLSCPVVSDSLQSHESQHAGPPCPSPTPGVCSNSCSLSQWCHPAISSSVVPFSFCPQSLPASGSFPVSQFFASGGQSIGVSASTSVLPMNTQDWCPLEWTGWISFQSKGLQVSCPTPQFKSINSSMLSFLYSPILTSMHDYWKNHSLE